MCRRCTSWLVPCVRYHLDWGHTDDQAVIGLCAIEWPRLVYVDAGVRLFLSSYGYNPSDWFGQPKGSGLWAEHVCTPQYFLDGRPPALKATGVRPFLLYFNGPASKGRHGQLAQCVALFSRVCGESIPAPLIYGCAGGSDAGCALNPASTGGVSTGSEQATEALAPSARSGQRNETPHVAEACTRDLDEVCEKHCSNPALGRMVGRRSYGHPNIPWPMPREALWRCLPASAVRHGRYHATRNYCSKAHGPLLDVLRTHASCIALSREARDAMAIPVEYAQHDGLDSLSVAVHLQTFTFYAKGLGEASQRQQLVSSMWLAGTWSGRVRDNSWCCAVRSRFSWSDAGQSRRGAGDSVQI